ncbi:MAG: GNAT family N-acetyltransferase [Candidatus Margulisbacteria bacterium]|nr:GNAT family N-acetyltransferase [Candidatus Margulisiibacteriota bacterium]
MNKFEKQYMPAIETDRLIIRPFYLEDISDAYREWINDEDVTRFLRIKKNMQSDDNIRNYVLFHLEETISTKHFAIFDNVSLILSGTFTCPNINWEEKSCEISFVIGHPDFQGKGLASETVAKMLEILFYTFDLEQIRAGYFEGHEASRRILEKNKFMLERIISKDYVTDDGKELDNYICVINRSRFEQQL